jgi:ABC-type glycerol-3-phosphate transport system substrate-binding protein
VSLKNSKSFLLHVLVVSVVFFTALAAAFASKKGEEGSDRNEIKFWHSLGLHNKDVLNSLIKTFNKTNRQTPVIGVFQGNERDLYLNLISQENRPDIVQLPVQLLGPLIEKGLIADMTPLIPENIIEDIPDKFWNTVTKDGRIYGMPFSFNVNILYVNQHIIRISGVRQGEKKLTWDSITEIAGKIKKNTRDKWGLYVPLETSDQFIAFTQSYTGKPLIKNGKIEINTADVIGAMYFLQKLVYEDKIMPAKITVDEGEGLFLSGNLGIMLASSSMLVYLESQLPYDLNVWSLPSGNETAPVITGTCLAIIASDPRRERDTFKFIKFLVSDENSIKWHTHTGSPLIRTSAANSLDLLIFYEDNPNHITPVIELEKGKVFNPASGFSDAEKIIKKALEEIMINRGDPEDVLNKAQSKIDKLNIMY